MGRLPRGSPAASTGTIRSRPAPDLGRFSASQLYGRARDPFIFGPVGGGERAPFRLRMDYGVKGHLIDATRDLANVVARWNPWLHATFGAAHLILAKTPTPGWPCRVSITTRSDTLSRLGCPVQCFSAIGPGRSRHPVSFRRTVFFERYAIRSAGLCEVAPGRPQCTADMVGAGLEGRRWRRLCQTLGIAHAVEWHGWMLNPSSPPGTVATMSCSSQASTIRAGAWFSMQCRMDYLSCASISAVPVCS